MTASGSAVLVQAQPNETQREGGVSEEPSLVRECTGKYWRRVIPCRAEYLLGFEVALDEKPETMISWGFRSLEGEEKGERVFRMFRQMLYVFFKMFQAEKWNNWGYLQKNPTAVEDWEPPAHTKALFESLFDVLCNPQNILGLATGVVFYCFETVEGEAVLGVFLIREGRV